MTIRHMTGSIFDSGADAIVIPTNTVGVQGAGLAKQAAKRWPAWSRAYAAACKRGDAVPGTIWYHRADTIWIVALATKDHWRDPSRIEWVEYGLHDLVNSVGLCEIASVAIPALGCGYGGLAWEDVRPRIERAAEQVPWLDVLVYPPQNHQRR